MGTNYYVAENICECCKRYDVTHHIGKSSWGWAFSFRGHREKDLTSWSAWKRYLQDKQIVDEYGDLVKVEDFIEMIETVRAPGYVREDGHKNLSHNEYGKKGQFPYFDARYDWDDEAGYSFTTREFS